MLNWFSCKEVDALADSIMAELLERFPRAGTDLSDGKSVERALKSLDRMIVRIGSFGAERRPNFYQKAHFANRIKWAMKDAGYAAPFVEAATYEFLKHLT